MHAIMLDEPLLEPEGAHDEPGTAFIVGLGKDA